MPGVARRAAITARDFAAGALCRGCRRQQQQQQQRRFASSSLAPPTKLPAAGLARLPARQLLSLTGSDAAKFLQGIVTANVTTSDGHPRRDAFYAGFLNATGRVLHDVFVYPQAQGLADPQGGSGFLVEVDANYLDALARYVKRYKLRAKVAVRKIAPDELTVWHAWDDTSSGGLLPRRDESTIVLKDPRAPGLGHRIVRASEKPPELDLDLSSEDVYTVRRYLNGVAEGQDEILREQALPQESNMDVMNGVDFHKGCYVGQELTIRTKHRGVVRKRILPCMIYEKDKAPPQTLSYDLDANSTSLESPTADMIPRETSIGRFAKRGRSAGKWLKGVGNIGLGLCRLEIMTDLALPGEQSAAASEDDEFVLEWGGEEDKVGVKVKAFVPDWLRGGLDQPQR